MSRSYDGLRATPDSVPRAPTMVGRLVALARPGSGGPPDAILIVVASAVLVAGASVLACLGGPNALLFDNLQELVAAAGGALGLALARRREHAAPGWLLVALAVSLTGAVLGMLAWDLAPLIGAALERGGDLVFAGSACLGAAAILPVIFGSLRRDLLAGVVIDALIVFLAGITLVAAIWKGAIAGPSDHAADIGAVTLVAVAAACGFALMARRIVPSVRGPWVLLAGAFVLSLAWLTWIGDPAASSTVGASDFMFSVGVLLIAYGGITWHTRTSDAAAFERFAPVMTAGLPVAAILASLGVTAVTHGPALVDDLVGTSTAAVIVTAVARQVHLYTGEARARAAERRAGQRLTDELRERANTLLSLERLEPGPSLEGTSRRVCEEALKLDEIDLAAIRAYRPDGTVATIALASRRAGAGDLVGQLLPNGEADRTVSRAAGGAWEWRAGDADDPYHGALRRSGMQGMVQAPLRWDGRVVGDICLATCARETAIPLGERLSTVEEFAVVAAALLGPTLAERDRVNDLRRDIEAIVAGHAFSAVYQPIVDIPTRQVLGYEAFTRFDSGRPPGPCFADAWSVGVGPELELATLARALTDARRLPAGRWLDLNVSPRLLDDPARLRDLLHGIERPLVLEIGERELVADYARLRGALRTCGPDVRFAIDDAGAGTANFAHIIELRPHFVKLDASLVRQVNANLGRQALVVAMRHLSRSTGCRLVAEGIETDEEARTLVNLGVDLGQGSLFGRPVSARELARLGADDDRGPVHRRSGSTVRGGAGPDSLR